MKKIAIIVSVALFVGLFFGFLWGRQGTPLALAPAPQQDASMLSRPVSLMIDYGDGTVRTYPIASSTAPQTMLQLLESHARTEHLTLSTKEFAGLGILIEAIGGVENGDKGKYWQYWVNNVSIPYAVDKYQVQPGDVIEWKFLNYR